MNEFDIIEVYFNKQVSSSLIKQSIGDDCAVITPPNKSELVTSIDTLVSGIHFPENTSPYHIGYKSLAVSLSDLAACGAMPHSFTLALTLPQLDKQWLAEFSKGLFAIANEFQCELIGGDTTKGPLSITIQVIGFTPQGKTILRSGAQVSDYIFISNTLGGPRLALRELLKPSGLLTPQEQNELLSLLNQPIPQVKLGTALKDIANSAIDLSDGFAADLGHILKASNVSADINYNTIPIHPLVKKYLPPEEALKLALQGGDDYQLCFTIPPEQSRELSLLKQQFHLTQIGVITNKKDHQELETYKGYQHF